MNNNYKLFKRISNNPEYSGKWIIILNEKVIANGSALQIREIMNKIRTEHPNETPFIAKIPKKIMQIV